MHMQAYRPTSYNKYISNTTLGHFLMKMDLIKTCQYAKFAINLSTLLMLVGIDILKTMCLNLNILEQAKAKG